MKRILLMVLCVSIILAACSRGELSVTFQEDKLAQAGDVAPAAAVTQEPTPSPAAASSPTASPIPSPTRIKLLAAGDLTCLHGQMVAARKKGTYDFNYCFAEIKEKVASADIAIANLETLIVQDRSYTGPHEQGEGNPIFNAPEQFLSAIAGCGFDVMINANNHIYDLRKDGIDKTIAKIEEYGMLHAGAYPAGREKEQLIIDAKGIKVAVLGYAMHINGSPRIGNMVDKYSEELVSADIKAAKEAGADFILVYMHWGKENTHKASRTQMKQAKFIANAGADIIIGSHTHCVQGIENVETERGNVPVFYSLGNLISSATKREKRESALVNIVIEKDTQMGKTTLTGLTYIPTLCRSTDEGRNIIFPADVISISQSSIAKALESSRKRIVKVMGDIVAQPE